MASQSSQRSSQTFPPVAPLVAPVASPVAPPIASDDAPSSPAAGVHPDVLEPPCAPYAQYTIEDLLSQPEREEINEKAKTAFVSKAKTCLTNTVLDWNDLWEFKGYEVKPNFLMNEAWVSNSNQFIRAKFNPNWFTLE
ncbi:hypothetical protein YC2023_053315 [Brassica napus]